MRDCSFDPCRCDGKPVLKFGTPEYARGRYHVDAGDRAALRQMTAWLEAGEPFCHTRWADGEFNSLCSIDWVNSDGQHTRGETLGAALRSIMADARDNRAGQRLLFGIDYTGVADFYQYLVDHRLFDIPWCPSQVFVNGIPFGETLRFLQAVRAWTGPVILVANSRVARVAPSMHAHPVVVPDHNAWDEVDRIADDVRHFLRPGGLVIYSAGMTANVLAHRFWDEVPGSTHVDVGCVFDGAVGIISRGWLEHEDPRTAEYRRSIIPWLLSTE